jgi:hypothetical protein
VITAIVLGSFIAGLLLGALMQFQRIVDHEMRCATLQERNDRLVEAVAQSSASVPVAMPRQPVAVESGSGWWDTRPLT